MSWFIMIDGYCVRTDLYVTAVWENKILYGGFVWLKAGRTENEDV